MKHQITVDGQERQIDIRPMDEDFIVYRKMYVPPLTLENIGQVNPGDWGEHLDGQNEGAPVRCQHRLDRTGLDFPGRKIVQVWASRCNCGYAQGSRRVFPTATPCRMSLLPSVVA